MTNVTDTSARERAMRVIRAMRAKTVERGATEAEAMAAADKIAELMDEYHLGFTETELREGAGDTTILTDDIPNPSTITRPIDYCLRGIQRFCGVKMWNWWVNGKRTVRTLGQRADIEMAMWLHQMIDNAIWTELATWQKDPATGWKFWDGSRKKAECKTFNVNMAVRINERLIERAEARAKAQVSTGTSLMVLRNQLVDEEFARISAGWRWRTASRGLRTNGGASAEAGRAAGNRVNFDRPVGGGANYKRIGG